MRLLFFLNVTERDKSQAVEELIKDSTPSKDFFIMTILSVLMATLGLLIDSASFVIGSMLIAPILSPVLSMAMGLVMSDSKILSRSFFTVLKAVAYGIAAAAIATMFFSNQSEFSSEIMSRTEPSLIYAVIAVLAGFAASLSLIKPQLSDKIPGIAISVALIPPLAVTGIGLARFSWTIISGSLMLFLVNIIGILFASMITFSLMNLYVKRNIALNTIKKEEEQIIKEQVKIEKEKEKIVEEELKEKERIIKKVTRKPKRKKKK